MTNSDIFLIFLTTLLLFVVFKRIFKRLENLEEESNNLRGALLNTAAEVEQIKKARKNAKRK